MCKSLQMTSRRQARGKGAAPKSSRRHAARQHTARAAPPAINAHLLVQRQCTSGRRISHILRHSVTQQPLACITTRPDIVVLLHCGAAPTRQPSTAEPSLQHTARAGRPSQHTFRPCPATQLPPQQSSCAVLPLTLPSAHLAVLPRPHLLLILNGGAPEVEVLLITLRHGWTQDPSSLPPLLTAELACTLLFRCQEASAAVGKQWASQKTVAAVVAATGGGSGGGEWEAARRWRWQADRTQSLTENIPGSAQPAASLPARAANSFGLFRESTAVPPSPAIAVDVKDRMQAPRRST